MSDNTNRNYNRRRPEPNLKNHSREYRYNNSSSAYDYQQRQFTQPLKPIMTEYELQRKMHENRKALYHRKEMERKKKIKIHKMRQARKINTLNFALVCILMLYLAGTLIFILSIIDNNTEIKMQINEKQQVINDQEKRLSDARIALANSIDINEIERVAKEELDMQIPAPDQIVYITLPKNRDYIEYEDVESKPKKEAKVEDASTEDTENVITDESTETDSTTTEDTEKTTDKVDSTNEDKNTDIEENNDGITEETETDKSSTDSKTTDTDASDTNVETDSQSSSIYVN